MMLPTGEQIELSGPNVCLAAGVLGFLLSGNLFTSIVLAGAGYFVGEKFLGDHSISSEGGDD